MRLLRLSLFAILIVSALSTSSCSTAASESNDCSPGVPGIKKPVPDVRGLCHDEAVLILQQDFRVNCCACTKDDHHNYHAQSWKVSGQSCVAPNVLTVDEVVTLTFDMGKQP
jgi:hypothetical protein